jgi:O-antigen export system ATP-binding protein rfbB
MILDNTKIRRLVIFLFYDKDGIVDDYIPALFDGLKDFYDELCFVANGKLQKKGREKVEKYVTNFLVRENKGFDVWGYKAGLEFYGWEELEKYDEVILMNYTIFGPLYPFSEMFEFMNKKDLDFWGITKHHKVDFDVFNTCKYGYIPEHIQSSFLVIRNSLLRTKDYQDLWKNMPMINSYAESVGLYEVIFTKEFNEKGYKSGVYIDTSDLEGYTRYPLMMMSDELIINRRCPIIKLKSFSQNYMDIIMDTIGSCTINSYEFIKNNTSYDVDLIWQNILRTSNMASIKRLMHLNYILPTDYEIKNSDLSRDKILLIFHIYFEDLLDESIKYMKSMPKNSDLLITTPKKELKEKIELKIKGIEFKNIEIRVIENRGRDVSSLLVGAKDVVMNYDYICFMHDKKTTQLEPYCAGQGFRYKCYENNLATKEYVKNLIGLFKENKRLGMLMPSPPNHSNFFHTIGNEWASNLKETKKLAKILDLNVDIHWGAEPISPLGTMFWFRPQALKKLFDYGWTYSDFPEEPNDHDGTILHGIERIYGFVTQDAGYYCAWCFTEKLARIELTNTFFGLGEINRAVFKKNYTTSLYGVVDLISHNKINLSYKVKIFLKKVLPKSLWRKFKNIYHKLKGIK